MADYDILCFNTLILIQDVIFLNCLEKTQLFCSKSYIKSIRRNNTTINNAIQLIKHLKNNNSNPLLDLSFVIQLATYLHEHSI